MVFEIMIDTRLDVWYSRFPSLISLIEDIEEL